MLQFFLTGTATGQADGLQTDCIFQIN